MDFLPWPNVVLAGLEHRYAASLEAFNAMSFKPTKTGGLCHSKEGWGPVSPSRDFDLTHCFEYGILIPALLGLLVLFGLPRAYVIWKRSTAMAEDPTAQMLRGKKSLFFLWSKMSKALDLKLIADGLTIIAFVVAAWLTRVNHLYTRRSSTILLVFYPLFFGAQLTAIRTSAAFLSHSTRGIRVAEFALSIALTALTFVVWMLECVGPEMDEMVDGFVNVEEKVKESPYVTANIYSRLAFYWMTPLMKLGSERYIVQEDLDDLGEDDSSENLGKRLQYYWDKENAPGKKPSLWRALFRAYGAQYAWAATLKVFSDLLQFAQPQLLRYLLAYIAVYQRNPEYTSAAAGFAWAVALFLCALAQTAILHQYFQLCFVTGSRVRAGLVMVIYNKSLVLSNDDAALDKSVDSKPGEKKEGRKRGDVVNLMSVDASRLQDLCTYGLIIASGPFQVILAFISLYDLLGWPAFVGVAVMFISVPVSSVIARVLKRFSEEQMRNRDSRTTIMSEILNNVKSIKLYSWENTFAERVFDIRNGKEIPMLRKIGVLGAINQTFWGSVPMIVAFSSFCTAAYFGSIPLTADVIFPSISLFLLLGFPLGVFPMVFSSIITAMVSVNRLASFLRGPELQHDARTLVPPPPKPSSSNSSPTRSGPGKMSIEQGDAVMSIRNGEFRWSEDAKEPTLENINLEVKSGELLAVLGRVGSGKSSLLSAIIGEMTRLEGAVEVYGTIAYAPQNPWIMSTSVRDNITFYRHFDEDFYNAVLDACALRPDLALLPQGDMTELSGGQRARISLARCVYARADLYLLDDVLAAVDAHVARHLFDRVIGPRGLLAQKARIVVTNSVANVKEYDQIVLLRRGIILEEGTYETIMSKPDSELCKLIASNSGTTTPIITDGESTAFNSLKSDRTRAPSDSADAEAVTIQEKLHALLQERPPVLSRKEQQVEFELAQTTKSTQFVKEISQQGKVKWSVYWKYMEAASGPAVIAYILTTIAQQGFTLLSNFALRSWGEYNEDTGENADPTPYLMWYGIWILASGLASLVSGFLLWVFCAVQSARYLHDSMLTAVLRAPLGWFERTPMGRILNLFSKDVNVVDETLPRVFQGFFRTGAVVLAILVVMGISIPLSLIAVVPLAFAYYRIMQYYLATSRELKRLDAVSRSPIFAWFQESLGGLSTIRSFQLQDVFSHTNEMRSDANLKAYLPSTYVNRWLAVRLEFIGALIVLVGAVVSVATLVISGKIDSGLVGLVLSYTLNTTQSLNWVIRSASDVEQNIVSVERILQYVELEPEAPAEIPETKPQAPWPPAGEIKLEEFSMRYRKDLEPVLRGISLDIKAGERLGICGRTGAGKSSLILGLLRINEADGGRILIDGVDISTIGLHDLRSAISIIPQEPQLFAGTIRNNVDVTGANTDEEIWHALDQVHLKQTVSSLGGLDAPVREGGSSLSAGQRQLICFARALIRHSKILILDEATSAVDLESDQAIQQVLAGDQFKGVTRLTIAHRLHTIIDSDRILVLEAGKVAELDTPAALLAKPESIFASLAAEAGIA
ncbi:hypothetical protein DL93DRAFT_2125118 [Clavulina sp. PMI_390]|nr:hypothetical protein DL93DRAFT_2125118 [Clavulina sp. PMI_390]